jgi:hypothetical protein
VVVVVKEVLKWKRGSAEEEENRKAGRRYVCFFVTRQAGQAQYNNRVRGSSWMLMVGWEGARVNFDVTVGNATWQEHMPLTQSASSM